jgi:protein TonB
VASASNASRAETTSSAPGSTGTGSGTNSRPSVDVTAITTRDDFLLELGEVLGGQASIRPVESMSAALEHLTNAKRGQVLVVDTRDVTDVRADIDHAHSQAAHAVVLVFTSPETEKAVGAAVKGSNVFAVLPIPVDKRKTSAVFEGAMADAVARKSSVRAPDRNPSPSVSVEPFQPGAQTDSGDPTGSEEGKSKMGLMIGAGVAVVAIAVGAFMFMGKNKGAAPPAAGQPAKVAAAAAAPAADTVAAEDKGPQVETSLIKGKIDDLLEKARLAMRERRYSEPVGDNALLYYRSAAAVDPSNGEAVDGLQRVAAVLAARFDESMNGGKLDEASLALANLKSAAPNDSKIQGMEVRLMTAQIAKSLADGNIDRAQNYVRQASTSPAFSADQINKWKTEIGRRQEEVKVQKMAGMVSDRIRDGRLVEPADDSAKLYMQQLHDAAPTNSTTQRLTRDLNAAYMHKAREAAMANKAPEVDRWLAEARAGGVSNSEITSFQKELASARQKAINAESDRVAQLVRDRMRDGRLSDPANDSAVYYLNQLQTTDANNPVAAQLSKDLAGKFVERARAAAQTGKGGTTVDGDLNFAKRFGADPKDVAAVQAISTPKTAAGRSAQAAGISAQSLAASLKRKSYTAPEFPSKALSQHLSGAVTVEYTVDTNGETRDVRVIEATPPGVFDRSATAAVKRWRYEPVVANGTPVEVPVRTSIRFELPK